MVCFFFSSRRRHTRYIGDWSSDVCSSDLFCRLGSVAGEQRVLQRREHAPAHRELAPTFLGEIEHRIEHQLEHRPPRSEERRVGKECRSRWCTDTQKETSTETIMHRKTVTA